GHFEGRSLRRGPVYHGLLWSPAHTSVEAWSAFVTANNPEVVGPHEWDIFPDGRACGLVRGDGPAWEEFRRLAESGSALLTALDPTSAPEPGHHSWVSLLYETA